MQPSHRTALALVLLNLVLKWCWLGVNELAHDEPFTMYWALRPIGALWTMLGTENNPPLYFLLMKAWGMLVPLDAAWWRIPSATFSALAVWPLYLLTRQLGGARIALVQECVQRIHAVCGVVCGEGPKVHGRACGQRAQPVFHGGGGCSVSIRD